MSAESGFDVNVLRQAAAFLAELNRHAGKPEPESHWEVIVAKVIAGETPDLAFINATAAPMLRSFNGYGPELQSWRTLLPDPERTRLFLGSIAKAASLRHALDAEHGDVAYKLSYGALAAMRALPRQTIGSGGPADFQSPALGLLVLGMCAVARTETSIFFRKKNRRASRMDIAKSIRFPNALLQPRKADLYRLTRGIKGMRETIDRVFLWSMEQPEELELLLGLDESSKGLNNERWWHLSRVWPPTPQAFWKDTGGFAPKDRALLERLAGFALPRGDVSVSDGLAIFISPQGLADALLAECVTIAGDNKNMVWHETSVSREFRDTWRKTYQVRSNVVWLRSAKAPQSGQLFRPVGQGEADALVLGHDVLIEVQAKSARSFAPGPREELSVVDARGQHKRFGEALDEGMWAIKERKAGSYALSKQVGNITKAGRVHIPITVGTDVISLWAVGGSQKEEGFARVLTTLDHLRIVNSFVPELLRPGYWLDRYAQEHESLRFVDEVDFLERWLGRFSDDEASKPLRVLEELVLAEDSAIERSITIENSFGSLKGIAPELDRILDVERGVRARSNPLNEKPHLRKLLTSLRQSSPNGYLLLLRSLPGVRLRSLEARIRERRSSAIESPVSPWVLNPGSQVSPELKKACFSINEFRGTWSFKWLASREELADSWKKAQFPGVAKALVK